ncbi:MFS transporter [Microbacterium sp. NPDC087591]|jgi:MFS family permease|uniref:MFS transporter n=1 Tax=Microbacterium sp. NPDC087591 TaxID=3364192 RepID=UPI0038302AA7
MTDARTAWPAPQGRLLLAGSALVLAFSAVGFLVQTFGIFAAALEDEFDWSRTATYSVLAIATLLTPVLIPLTGWASDRFPVRVLVLCALGAEVVCLVLLGILPTSRIGFAVLFLATYAASFGASVVPLARSINLAFSHRRGAALGLLFAGACLGAIVNPLVAAMLVSTVGWQGAFIALGLQVTVLAGIPALLFIRTLPSRHVARRPQTEQSASWRALFGTRAMYVVLGWALFAAIGYGGMQGHLVPLLEERAHRPEVAVLGQSLLGVGLLAGNIAAGILLDRIAVRVLASLMLILPVGALGLLLAVPPGPGDLAITTTIGIATGTETAVLAYVVSRYVPPEINGRGLATGMVAVALGGGIGTMLGAVSHDATGSYHLFITASAASLVVAAIWPWALPARPLLDEPRGSSSIAGNHTSDRDIA